MLRKLLIYGLLAATMLHSEAEAKFTAARGDGQGAITVTRPGQPDTPLTVAPNPTPVRFTVVKVNRPTVPAGVPGVPAYNWVNPEKPAVQVQQAVQPKMICENGVCRPNPAYVAPIANTTRVPPSLQYSGPPATWRQEAPKKYVFQNGQYYEVTCEPYEYRAAANPCNCINGVSACNSPDCNQANCNCEALPARYANGSRYVTYSSAPSYSATKSGYGSWRANRQARRSSGVGLFGRRSSTSSVGLFGRRGSCGGGCG